MTNSKIKRCMGAKGRLEQQLSSNNKTKKKTLDVKIPLNEKDINRINKELVVLNKKI